jgi:hypothetical protein
MKTLVATLTIVMAAAASVAIAQNHSQPSAESVRIAGEWNLAFESPHGTMKASLKLQQEGTKITGSCEMAEMGTSTITGKVEGHNTTLTIALHGGEMNLTLNGTVADDKMSGTAAPMGGTWTAKRQ